MNQAQWGFDEQRKAKHIADNTIGEGGWNKGTPQSLIDVILQLRTCGIEWDDIEDSVNDIVTAIRSEYGD